MTDVVLNTLLAIAAMCNQHVSALTIVGGPTQYERGFEQCSVIQRAVDKEQIRRVEASQKARAAEDIGRLNNALAALHGKKFKPEPAPAPVPYDSGPCMELTPGSTFVTH